MLDDVVNGTFKKILVGTDDSQDAQLAFQYAITYAKSIDAELFIVSVLEEDTMNVYQALDDDYIHDERKDLEAHLLEYKKAAENAGVRQVQTFIGEGDPGKTIVYDVIPQIKPDLLIIGSFDKKGVARHFGSQAAYMAKYSPIPVLIMR
jgi:nucleotide-binding universal stress UspA family protein